MLIGLNRKNNLINIINSVPKHKYICPLCKEPLIRNYGVERQYFSHDKGKGEDCELRINSYIDNITELTDENKKILDKKYFKKKFNDIKVEMSDMTSELGYPLTKEQVDIILSTENKVKISATAGSSKTTTLYYYAKHRPEQRILYLVYNSAMKKEAEETFGKLSHVVVKTVHGLGYQYVGRKYQKKLIFNYTPVDVLNDLSLSWYSEQDIAVKVHLLLQEYMLSDCKEIEDVDLFRDEDNIKFRDEIVSLAKKLWELKKNIDSEVKVEHDFYLKLFELSKENLSSKYDIVMLDEAQDSNMVTFNIVKSLGIDKVVMVGDPHQQMYSWRKALNILDLFEGKEYKLTTSFRVSQNIANISNILISDVFGEDLQMKGFNVNQTITHKLDTTVPFACISRTNAALFQEAIDVIYRKGKNKKIFFEGGFNSYKFNNIRDTYYFSIGREVKNPILNKFDNYSQMKEYANENDDIELKSLIRAVIEYGSDIPSLVEEIRMSECKDKKIADIILTTAHKSKGATYENVKLCNDYAKMTDFFNKMHIEVLSPEEKEELLAKTKEECHILYVSITRAKGEIELNEDLKKYLLIRDKFF